MWEGRVLMRRAMPTICFFPLVRGAPLFALFPYTTLFRSFGVQYARGSRRSRPHLSRTETQRADGLGRDHPVDRKSTRLNSSHGYSSYADFCWKKKRALQNTRRLIEVYSRILIPKRRW